MRTVATLCSMIGVSLILGLPLWGVAFDLRGTQTLTILAAAYACFSFRLGLKRMVCFSMPGIFAIVLGTLLCRLGGRPELGIACLVAGTMLLVGSLLLGILFSALYPNSRLPEQSLSILVRDLKVRTRKATGSS